MALAMNGNVQQVPKMFTWTQLKYQKNKVKSAMKEPLRTTGLDSIWAPITMSWFAAWKNYVDFDDSLTEEPTEQVGSVSLGIEKRNFVGFYSYGFQKRRHF
jgi:hypothetical protein